MFWCPGALSFQKLWEPIFNAPATKVDLFYAGHVHAAEVQYPQVGGVVEQYGFDNVKSTIRMYPRQNPAHRPEPTRQLTLAPNPASNAARTP